MREWLFEIHLCVQLYLSHGATFHREARLNDEKIHVEPLKSRKESTTPAFLVASIVPTIATNTSHWTRIMLVHDYVGNIAGDSLTSSGIAEMEKREWHAVVASCLSRFHAVVKATFFIEFSHALCSFFVRRSHFLNLRGLPVLKPSSPGSFCVILLFVPSHLSKS